MADAEPMDVERELFKLSATLAGHEQDVRCVGALANNQVLTGSRDSSVRASGFGGVSSDLTLAAAASRDDPSAAGENRS